MTQAQLEALNNTLLASGQPDKIIGVKHRQMENAIIETIWDIQERGDSFKDLIELLSSDGTEKIFVIKNGVAKIITSNLLLSPTGAMLYKGTWDPSGGILPGTGKQGWMYKASADGVVGGFSISQGSWIFFLVDNPGQTVSNYDIR